jgi:hypothetical protein
MVVRGWAGAGFSQSERRQDENMVNARAEKGIIIGGVQLVVFTTKMILLCLTKGISKSRIS